MVACLDEGGGDTASNSCVSYYRGKTDEEWAENPREGLGDWTVVPGGASSEVDYYDSYYPYPNIEEYSDFGPGDNVVLYFENPTMTTGSSLVTYACEQVTKHVIATADPGFNTAEFTWPAACPRGL